MSWLRMAGAALAASSTLAAQQGIDPDELLHLEPVLLQAMQKAAPFVVTVETFGGARKILGADGPSDSAGPQPPRPQPPKPKPKPKPDDEGERPKPKPDMPLAQPGFHQTQGKTTGIILSPDGWILVSRFALNFDPSTILITLPGGETRYAERKGEDTSRGIALVKIDANDLPFAEFVHPDQVQVGQWAFALGRTFGLEEPTVHIGIVSAKRRQFGRALQIDAYTSPANYGGAVVDIHGRVLGVAVPLSPAGRDAGVEWYDSGIGFATTIADIPEIVDKMKQGDVLHRGWLGVQLELSHLGPGAKISGTPKDGVAAKAGLRKGDIILKVDGTVVQNGPHFQMLLSSRMGGDPVGLEVQKKNGEPAVSLTVILADTPYEERSKGQGEELPASFPLPEKK